MALLEFVETNQQHVVDLREELDRVRTALDRTDAVLGVADQTLHRAEEVVKSGRRWGPIALAVTAAVVAGVVVAVVLRNRRQAAGRDNY